VTRFIRSRFTASAAVLILLSGACRSPYREWVRPESSVDLDVRSIVNLGIYDARGGTIDADASRQLVESSGLDLFPSPLPPQDADLLGGDPGLLAFDRPGRRRLAEQIGRRRVLVGVVRPIAVDELREWGDVAPPSLDAPLVYGEKRDLLHEAIVIRLVDLESGKIDFDFLTITNRPQDRADRLRKSVASATRIMRLRSDR
jgi:hypothetical protein